MEELEDLVEEVEDEVEDSEGDTILVDDSTEAVDEEDSAVVEDVKGDLMPKVAGSLDTAGGDVLDKGVIVEEAGSELEGCSGVNEGPVEEADSVDEEISMEVDESAVDLGDVED